MESDTSVPSVERLLRMQWCDRPKCPPSDPPNRVVKFPKCPKMFPFSSSCSRHLLSHEKTRPYQCHEYSNSYARPYALRAHVLSHSKERSHKCEQCSKSYLQIGSHCDKSFKYPSNLSRHKRLHNGEKPMECEFCSKTFPRASDLKVHIHTGEKPYRCSNCNKMFSVISNMGKYQRKCLPWSPFLGWRVNKACKLISRHNVCACIW